MGIRPAAAAPRQAPEGGTCPFCRIAYVGGPDHCPRCGTLLGRPSEDLKRLGRAERRLIRSRKALSDTFFLVGLLLGGPLITIGHELRLGAFVVLAAGVASVLRRYTDWSTPGTALLGVLVAMVAASWVAESPRAQVEDLREAESTRAAFAQALAAQDPDIVVEARGPGLVALWYTVPRARTRGCGTYPAPEVRRHLAELGFRRVVVNEPNGSGGICSFAP